MERLGLALGSGGARGLAHLGVLGVLEEAGLIPACIAGTSMGAIVGALYAEHLDAATTAQRIAHYTNDPQFLASWEPLISSQEIQERGFFHEMRRSIQRHILTFRGITSLSMQSAERLIDPLRRILHTQRIEELQLPFAAVAVDLLSGQARVFRHGDLVNAVYASSAIPAVFPPLPWEGQLLTDGGGPCRVPVEVCRELGADFVIAVDIPSFSAEGGEYRTALDVFLRSDQITRNRLSELVLREADFVVRPAVAEFHWADFAAAERIRAAGEGAMRTALPELQRALRTRRSPAVRLRRLLRKVVCGDN